jgi:hypothetical protein
MAGADQGLRRAREETRRLVGSKMDDIKCRVTEKTMIVF